MPAAPDPYLEGLLDAMHPLPSEEAVDDLISLSPDQPGLRWDEQGRVLATTWSRSQYYDPQTYVQGYAFTLYGETWFSAGTQIADACAGLEGEELSLRAEQYLGLPEGGGRDAFVQVWIDPAALVRPCAAPDVTSTTGCTVAAPMQTKTEHRTDWWSRG